MYSALFVIYAIAIVIASPIPVHDCGILDSPHATYQLANNIIISNLSYGYVCLNIKGNGITLDGNGFGVSSATDTLLPAVGVQFSGTGATVTNLRITNLRTGIHANAKFGKVSGNTVTRAVNGIDVTATHNEISNNIIQDFDTTESASGIYVYFPAMAPVDSSIVIANNKIHDIRGEPFALGISVYYATSVVIKNNQIFNLHGISAEEISVINSKADLVDNVFNPITQDYDTATLLLSGFALLASLFYYRCSSNSTTPIPVPVSAPVKKVEKEEEEEEEEEEEFEEDKVSEEEKKKKEEEKAAFDKDGADEIRLRRPTVSFSIKASPSLG